MHTIVGVTSMHTIVGVMAMRQERCTSKYVSFETTCLLRRQVSGLEDMSLDLDIISVTKYARPNMCLLERLVFEDMSPDVSSREASDNLWRL